MQFEHESTCVAAIALFEQLMQSYSRCKISGVIFVLFFGSTQVNAEHRLLHVTIFSDVFKRSGAVLYRPKYFAVLFIVYAEYFFERNAQRFIVDSLFCILGSVAEVVGIGE